MQERLSNGNQSEFSRKISVSDNGDVTEEGSVHAQKESSDKGHVCDKVSDIDRFWDSLRVSLFAIIFGSALTFGIPIGLAFSWWLGLASFLTTFGAIYLLLRCKRPRNFIIRLMDPLIKPSRN
jgi:hypothetical protein